MGRLPRLLVIDDVFGRATAQGRNEDRENLCALFRWKDASRDQKGATVRLVVKRPTAEVVFCRGQRPVAAQVGETVENDPLGALAVVREGWSEERRFDSEAPEGRQQPWSMVLLDLCFLTGVVTPESDRRSPGMPEGTPGDDDPRGYFGLVLLDAIHREFPDLPVLILSSKPREEVSREFSRRGALGFIARDDPGSPDLLQEAVWRHGLLEDSEGGVVGRSIPLLLALREARRGARHRESLLLLGERGVGKELLARYVHRMSETEDAGEVRPFVVVNSAAVTPTLFASELFGIEAKVASGVDAKVGLIERADGGDLFFDEIADMPPEAQAGILRVLQERQVTRVGGHRAKEVDVRFLSATNVDLEGPARGFRGDLLDRLRAGGTLTLPPLRERREDIPLLVERFLREAEGQRGGAMRREVSGDALEILAAHPWPGNVRELRSVVFEAVTRFPDVEHLVPEHLRIAQRPGRAGGAAGDAGRARRGAGQTSGSVPSAFDALLGALGAAEFLAASPTEWAGRLPELQREQQRAAARLLLAALGATKRRTPDQPQGIVQIHPAMKLLTGDADLSASAAADAVKRLLKPIEDELEGDLRAAYEVAARLRPKSPPAAKRPSIGKGG